MRAKLRRTGRAAKLARHLPDNPLAGSMLASRVLERESIAAPIARAGARGVVGAILSWLAFEVGIAPLLGLPQAKRPDASESLALAADHVLYGSVVAASGFARRA